MVATAKAWSTCSGTRRGQRSRGERLRLLPNGQVYYAFKKAWRDGSRGVVMSGEDFVGRVAALIPRPQVNLVPYQGCLAPGSKIRGVVVRDSRPATREKIDLREVAESTEKTRAAAGRRPAAIRDRNYRWHELMKRVLDLDVLECPGCGGRMKQVAEMDGPVIARKILEHLGLRAQELALAPARGPPEDELDEPPRLGDEGM